VDDTDCGTYRAPRISYRLRLTIFLVDYRFGREFNAGCLSAQAVMLERRADAPYPLRLNNWQIAS